MAKTAKTKWHFLTVPLDGGVRETDLAQGFSVDHKIVWVPKSRISDFKHECETVSFWIEEWLMIEKGLEDFVDTSREPTLF